MMKLWRWLTCQDRLGTGPYRLLLVLSVPFFVYFIVPGIVFWLLVRATLWVVDGFKKDIKSRRKPR